MARHLKTDPWWRTFISLRVRAALTLGLLFGFATVGTMAYWSDQSTAQGAALEAGRLDLTVNGQLPGQGGVLPVATITATDLIPNESVAYLVTVGNGGTVPFLYRATATASGTLASHVRFSVFVGGTPSNTGTGALGNRAGTCTGTATATNVTLGTTPATVIGSDLQLDPGVSQSVCIRVALPTGASAAAQGQTATARFDFNARNLGAPS